MRMRLCLALSIIACAIYLFPIQTKADKQMDKYEVMEICEEVGNMYHICPEIIFAIVERESTLYPNATNGSCKGLCQVSERWHKDRMEKLGVTDIYDPYGNILVATDYLYELFEEWEDLPLVLDIYNGNSSAMQNAEDGIISKYAQKIIDRAMELEEQREDGNF